VSDLRLWVAVRISPSVEICETLLRGESVDPAQLDHNGLAWATSMQFVRLAEAPIELFEEQLREASA
jgi:hypothetical protein